ncbi:flagellar basal body rod protein FlgB [Oceanobacillus alkalisoli]|uniref:flagellar basal body rod protein FlgB n=1 Tax=Oceanobacillus alkalisoli TaxID=2925113 RepID=UPI001EEFEBEA|nr:flagellar basal body rod protein FlgB [Oceanobacillus alkalisoli]MCF3942439.1 flagellar basal body rod protein FlgB [Oceanobacillus alkalisoli]MCG5103496.1 flagellar basal body rod protein FlgB [Oceanobacillus alkalisoli]
MDLFGGTISNLERSLDYASARNRTISNNIANVDTPNYKSQDVVFKHVLTDAMSNQIQAKRTDPRHIPFSGETGTNYQVVANNNTTYNHNGNNVDIDREMTELAKNQIYYNGLIDRINGKFGSLQTVLRGGN